MKKNIKEILENVTPNTLLKEVIAYCDNMEDVELIIANLPKRKVSPFNFLTK